MTDGAAGAGLLSRRSPPRRGPRRRARRSAPACRWRARRVRPWSRYGRSRTRPTRRACDDDQCSIGLALDDRLHDPAMPVNGATAMPRAVRRAPPASSRMRPILDGETPRAASSIRVSSSSSSLLTPRPIAPLCRLRDATASRRWTTCSSSTSAPSRVAAQAARSTTLDA